MPIEAVPQNNLIACWASISSNQRFVSTGTQVEVRNTWTWTERLTGKVRLETNLKKIHCYLDHHPNAFQIASRRDLLDFQKNIQRIQKDYYQKHWRIYIFIFGKSVHKLCQTLINQVGDELKVRSEARKLLPRPNPPLQLPIQVEEKIDIVRPKIEMSPAIEVIVQANEPSTKVTFHKIEQPTQKKPLELPRPPVLKQAPKPVPAPLQKEQTQPIQETIISPPQTIKELTYQDIRHDPEKVREFLAAYLKDAPHIAYRQQELTAICELMTEEEITKLMALHPNGFHLKVAKLAFPLLVQAMSTNKLKHLIQVMGDKDKELYIPQFVSIFSYDKSILHTPLEKRQLFVQVLRKSDLFAVLQEILMYEQELQKTVLTILKQGIIEFPPDHLREAYLQELATFCVVHLDLYESLDKSRLHTLLDAYVLKERLKDPYLDFLSFQQILTATIRGLDPVQMNDYLRALAQDFFPLMEEKEWALYRRMWNAQQVNPHCLKFFSLLCLQLRTTQRVQERFTQLLDTQATYQGVYLHIKQLADLAENDQESLLVRAAIRGYFLSPLFQQLGFDQFLEHFKTQLQPTLSLDSVSLWVHEVTECDQKLALWDLLPHLKAEELSKIQKTLSREFDLPTLLVSYTKQKDKRTNTLAFQVIKGAVEHFFQQYVEQQDELFQMLTNASDVALSAALRFLMADNPVFFTTQPLNQLLKQAFDEPVGKVATAVNSTLKQVVETEFLHLVRNQDFTRCFSYSEKDFINFYLHFLPVERREAFLSNKGKEIFEDDAIRNRLSTNRILTELLKQEQVEAASTFAKHLYPRDKKDIAKLDPLVVVDYAFSEHEEREVFLQLFLYALKEAENLPVDQMLKLVNVVPVEKRTLAIEHLLPSLALQFFLAISWGEAPNEVVEEQKDLRVKIIARCATIKNGLSMQDYLTQENLLKPGYRQVILNLTEEIMDAPPIDLQESYANALIECLEKADQLIFLAELSSETFSKILPYLSLEMKINYWIALPPDKMSTEWNSLKMTEYPKWFKIIDEILHTKPLEIVVKIFTTMKDPKLLDPMSKEYFDKLKNIEVLVECLKYYQGPQVASIRQFFFLVKNGGKSLLSACIPLMTLNQLRGLCLGYQRYNRSPHNSPNKFLPKLPQPSIKHYFMDVLIEGAQQNEEQLDQLLQSHREKHLEQTSLEDFKQLGANYQILDSEKLSPVDMYLKFGYDLEREAEVQAYVQATPFNYLRVAWPTMKPSIREQVLDLKKISEDEKKQLQNYCFERLLFARLNQSREIVNFVSGLSGNIQQKLFGPAWEMNGTNLLANWQTLTLEGVRVGFARHIWTNPELKKLIQESDVERLLAFYDLLSNEQKRQVPAYFSVEQKEAVDKMFSRL